MENKSNVLIIKKHFLKYTQSLFLQDKKILNLIDEMQIFVHPIILGKGILLFSNIKKDIKLKLVDTFKLEGGLVKMEYKILRD